MGVQGLWSLIQPVARPIQLETLEGRKLAIDSSIWLYHFRMAMRDKEGKTLKNAHILGFFYRILKLLFYGIRPVFVFDGAAPTLKRKTLSKRRQVREGARDAHAVTAKKLLNAQLRQAALKEVKSRSSTGKKRSESIDVDRAQDEQDEDEDENGLGENTVYFDDLDAPRNDNRGEGSSRGTSLPSRRRSQTQEDDEWMDEVDESTTRRRNSNSKSRSISPTKKPVKKNDYHRDPYALPEMERDFSVLTRTNGNNKRNNRTDVRFATETEQRELMSQLKPSDLDTTSSFFQSLPVELQYELLGDMRSQSRGTSYKRLQSMLSSAPTPIDFSKAQIDGLKTRNKLTQKVLEVSDSIGDANIKISSSRVSSERNREYVLIKNKESDGIGYSLGIRDQGMSKEKAIEIGNSDDENQDDEDDEERRRGNDSHDDEGMDFDQVDLNDENIRTNTTTDDDDDDEDQGGLNQSQIDQARREGRMIADDPEKRLEILRKLRNENIQKTREQQKSRGMAGRKSGSFRGGKASSSNSNSRSSGNPINQRSGASLFLPEKPGSSSIDAIELDDEFDDDLDEDLDERGVGTSASRTAALGQGRYDLLEAGADDDWDDYDETLQDQGFAFEDFEDQMDSLPTEMRKRKDDDQLDLDEMDDLERALELSRQNNHSIGEDEEDMEMDEVEVEGPNSDEKKSFETNDYEAALAALDETNSSTSRSSPPPPISSIKQHTSSTSNSYPKRATHPDSGPALGFRYQDRTGEPERLDVSSWKKEREKREAGEKESRMRMNLSLEQRQELEREEARKKQIEKMRKGREYEDLEEQERLERENQKKKLEEKERKRLARLQREMEEKKELEQIQVPNSQNEDLEEEMQEVEIPRKSSPIQDQEDVEMTTHQSPLKNPSPIKEKIRTPSPPPPSVQQSTTPSQPASKVFDEISGSPATPSSARPSGRRSSSPQSASKENESRLKNDIAILTPSQLGSRRNAGAGSKAKIKYVSQDAPVEPRPEEIEPQAEVRASEMEDLAQKAAGVAQGDELGEKMEEDSEKKSASPRKSPIEKVSTLEDVEMDDSNLDKSQVNEENSKPTSTSTALDNISSKEAETTKPASNKRVRLLSPTSRRNPNIQYDSDSGTPFSDSDDDDNQPELGPDGFPMPTAEELAAMEAEDLEELGGSKDDFASFLSKSRSVGLSEAQEEIEREVAALKAEHANTRRTEEDITLQMAAEVQTMLRLFGIPFITAPAEAEAQCAELVILKLVDGIITDDSDVFCFGGNRVYKNMFNQNKIVECFLLSDLHRELGIDREKLVQLAYLLGSDYTEGLPGVGPVLAMEILALFDNQDGLINFRDWWVKVQTGSDSKDDTKGKTMKKIKKTLRNKVHLESNWPDPEVLDAYYEPKVDKSDEPFTWGLPDLDGLRTVLKAFLGWDQEKTDHHLLPVIESQRRRNKKKQSTLDRNGFFDNTGGLGAYSARQAPKYKSSRLQEVVHVFRNKNKVTRAGNSNASTNKSSTSKPTKTKKSKKSKKSKQVQDSDDDDLISASDQEGTDDEGNASSDGFEVVDEAVLGRAMGKSRPIVRRDEDHEAPQSNLDRNIEALEGESPEKKAPAKRKRGGGAYKAAKGKKKAAGKGKGKAKAKENSETEEDELDSSEDEDAEEFRPKPSRGKARGRGGRGRGRGASTRGGNSNKARLKAARSINLDEVGDEVDLGGNEEEEVVPKARPRPRAAARKKKSNEKDEGEVENDGVED